MAAVILVAASKIGAPALLWAAAPVMLLALVDGASQMEARRLIKQARDLSTKDRTDLSGALDLMSSVVKAPGYPDVLLKLGGFFTFSVAPFYLALAFGVAFVGWNVAANGKAGALEQLPAFRPSPNVPYNPQLSRLPSANSFHAGAVSTHEFPRGNQPIANFPGKHPVPANFPKNGTSAISPNPGAVGPAPFNTFKPMVSPHPPATIPSSPAITNIPSPTSVSSPSNPSPNSTKPEAGAPVASPSGAAPKP